MSGRVSLQDRAPARPFRRRPSAQPRGRGGTVSERSGIADQGQISKLLSRLVALELLENREAGQPHGRANPWHLTASESPGGRRGPTRAAAPKPLARAVQRSAVNVIVAFMA
jgi:hypothetical protein